MMGERGKTPVAAAKATSEFVASGATLEARSEANVGGLLAPAGREEKLVWRVYQHCHDPIREACSRSSLPPEFLGALTANESGGMAEAARFEPAVYRHLAAVAAGQSPAYGSIRAESIDRKAEETLAGKADGFHGRYLTASFMENNRAAIAAFEDGVLRQLATSWGYTQIMGYHLIGRQGTAKDLLDPRFHYRLAIELLSEFAAEYQLDLTRELEELFRCWNTGQPYGKTYDPAYVENGMRRMRLYREIAGQVESSRQSAGQAT